MLTVVVPRSLIAKIRLWVLKLIIELVPNLNVVPPIAQQNKQYFTAGSIKVSNERKTLVKTGVQLLD
jgi:hypothetical protein